MNKSIFLLLLIIIAGCSKDKIDDSKTPFYRDEMRNFVIELSKYAKNINSDFIIIPQNGQELVTDSGEGSGNIQIDYLSAIDATGRESMFYGYYNDDETTPEEDKNHLLGLCQLLEQNNISTLSTDYCYSPDKVDNSYAINNQYGFISFAADKRELNSIPTYPIAPYNMNDDNISIISDARNFLYIINSENYNTKLEFIDAVKATNYDVVLIDLFFNDEIFTASEIQTLKTKDNGGSRLVIAYMSIGEAEDYRYYWNQSWNSTKPIWLDTENPDWTGNFKVKYWYPGWKSIIFGNDESYLHKILNNSFDGVYLDIIDGFEYFEEQ